MLQTMSAILRAQWKGRVEMSNNNLVQCITETSANKTAGAIRLMLGVMFVMTGIMKLAVPDLGAAFAGQLQAANIPFQQFNIWFVPILETLVGLALLVGIYARLGALSVIGLMIVATFVHLVVDDPSLFPLQPELPIIPIVTIAMSAYLLKTGGGAWSADLKR